MTHKKKLFLLDAYALIYRAYFAFIKNPRINSKGLDTSAIFGFTNTLVELIRKEKPTHIAVCFDRSSPTFRHEEFEDYTYCLEDDPYSDRKPNWDEGSEYSLDYDYCDDDNSYF